MPLPTKLQRISFAESHRDARLQIAAVLAGASAYLTSIAWGLRPPDQAAKLEWEPTDGGAFSDGLHGFTTGRSRMVVKDGKGGETVRWSGAYVTSWRKDDKGRWKVRPKKELLTYAFALLTQYI